MACQSATQGRTGTCNTCKLVIIALLWSQESLGFQLLQRQPTSAKLRTLRRSASKLKGEYDVAVVGAGIGGLCAAAVLTQCYGKRVAVLESHYLPGGCAHAFDRVAADGTKYTFDSGPTIVLGCSAPPYNPLRQVLNAVGAGEAVEWLRYDGWGMVVPPNEAPQGVPNPGQWRLQLGPNHFENGPLATYGGANALAEFNGLREACSPLVTGAVGIPAMSMRSGPFRLLPLLRHWDELKILAGQGDLATGDFAPFLNGPNFVVTDPWLRAWLDALAFSLSGLPAAETSAGAMAYVLFDLHREGAALDYPKGGMGAIVNALVDAIEQGGSTVALSTPVANINLDALGRRAIGVTTAKVGNRKSTELRTKSGVVCNAPAWSLAGLLGQVSDEGKSGEDETEGQVETNSSSRHMGKPSLPPAVATYVDKTQVLGMTQSYMHLHLTLDATGLDLDALEAHYTVMDQGLLGGDVCGEANMIAVSNPCRLDPTLAPPGKIVVHAYACGNEPYEVWEPLTPSGYGPGGGFKKATGKEGQRENAGAVEESEMAKEDKTNGKEGKDKGGGADGEAYQALKVERAEVLWRAVERIIPDARARAELELIGSPLTHQRFLRRPRGTYGATFADALPDCATPVSNLVLCGDSVFPGIGVPAVALNGASAANTLMGPIQHWMKVSELIERGLV